MVGRLCSNVTLRRALQKPSPNRTAEIGTGCSCALSEWPRYITPCCFQSSVAEGSADAPSVRAPHRVTASAERPTDFASAGTHVRQASLLRSGNNRESPAQT